MKHLYPLRPILLSSGDTTSLISAEDYHQSVAEEAEVPLLYLVIRLLPFGGSLNNEQLKRCPEITFDPLPLFTLIEHFHILLLKSVVIVQKHRKATHADKLMGEALCHLSGASITSFKQGSRVKTFYDLTKHYFWKLLTELLY